MKKIVIVFLTIILSASGVYANCIYDDKGYSEGSIKDQEGKTMYCKCDGNVCKWSPYAN